MTGDKMREALKKLGWKQTDVCRRIDMNPNTVSKWANNGPPKWFSEYLGAMLAIDQIHRQFVRPLRPAAMLASDDDDDSAPLPNSRAAQTAQRLRMDDLFKPEA